MARTGFSRALLQWQRIVGKGNVRTERPEVDAASTATYASENRVVALVRPKTREEVRACVAVATSHRLPIYPISRGNNWGYGSRVPSHDASVVLDLSRMTKIVAVDRIRGSVTVQPGVTTLALYRHLRRHAPGWAAALPSATTLEASVVGNAMDGGISGGPYGDRSAHIYSLEVVLASGEVFRTGLDRLRGGSQLGKTEARVGPSLGNLFVQSNFGVVTEMTVGLFPLPNDLRSVRVALGSTEDIGPFLERVQRLMVERVLPDPLGIYSDYESISVSVPYPWARTYGRTPLPLASLGELREALQTPRWVASTEIASYDRGIGDAREQAVRRALDGYDVTVSDVTDARETYYAPSGVGMFGLYWRKRGGAVVPADPHRDRCGLLWCDFVMANDGPLLARALTHTEPLVRSFGFEPATEVHAVWPRATYVVISLTYDRDRPGDDERAEACDRALTAYLGRFNILPARRRVGSMDLMPAPADDSKEVFARLRAALDPAHVIAPGRYDGTARAPLRVARAQAPETASAQVESAHRAVLDGSSKKTAKSLPVGPLRPLFVERERYELARRTATEFLSALLAVAPTIAGSAVWQMLLGLDGDVANALLTQLEKSPITGLLSGVFDDDSSRYRPLGFDSSLAGIVESASLGRRAHPPGWSSKLRVPSLGRGIAVLGTEKSARYASTLCALERRASLLTPEALASRRAGAPVFSCDWRAVVGREGAPSARAAVLRGLPTNAPSDVLLATLAGVVVLHEEAAAGRLAQRRRSFVEEVVPWTALLEDGRARVRGTRVDLLAHVIANKSSFVLRPLYRSGSGVWVGEYVTDADWKKIVRGAARATRARRQPWVVQERVRIEHQTFPIRRAGGEVEFEGCFIGVDVPVFRGEIAPGLVARGAERPRVGGGCEGTFPLAALIGPPPRPELP